MKPISKTYKPYRWWQAVFIGCFVSLQFLNPFQFQAQEYPLDSLIQMAIQKNPSLKAMHLEVEALSRNVQANGVLPDPEFGAGIFIQSIETRTGPQVANLSAMQKFPWRGTLDAQKELFSSVADVQRSRTMLQSSSLEFMVEEEYWKWQLNQADHDILEAQIDLLNAMEELALSRFEAGVGSMAEVLLIQADRNRQLLERDQVQARETAILARLQHLTGNEQIIRPIKINLAEVSTPDFEREGIAESSLMERLAEAEISRASSQLRETEFANKPSMAAGLQYVLVGERQDVQLSDNGKDALLPSLRVSIPLNRSRNDARREFREMQLLAAEESLGAAKDETRKQRIVLLSAYEEASLEYAFAVEQARLIEETLDLLRAQYANDLAEMDIILKLESEKLQLERRKYASLVRMNIAIAGERTL